MQEYIPTVWENKPSVKTKLNAIHLNKMENALAFAINQVTANATLNADWSAGDAIGLEFKRVGNKVIAHFSASIRPAKSCSCNSASITSVTGMHLFIGTIPEGMRPSQITPFPAVFVPISTTDYEPRVMVINPDGTIMIAKNPTVTGTFFCNMVYFAE